jgi:hypothetical protein
MVVAALERSIEKIWISKFQDLSATMTTTRNRLLPFDRASKNYALLFPNDDGVFVAANALDAHGAALITENVKLIENVERVGASRH